VSANWFEDKMWYMYSLASVDLIRVFATKMFSFSL